MFIDQFCDDPDAAMALIDQMARGQLRRCDVIGRDAVYGEPAHGAVDQHERSPMALRLNR